MSTLNKENNKQKDIRLRLAPSPTGFLHIGNLRTALFTYLLSKKWGGKFILRIEDTDQKRIVPGASEKLIEILKIMGLEFDEGPHLGGDYGPYIQSQRQEIYQQYAQQLLESGQAYRCFCSSERLQEMRSAQEAKHQAPRYDGLCRQLDSAQAEQRAQAGEKFVLRQKMSQKGKITVNDELRGAISFQLADLDDQVLIKSNGLPTYQFANVIDDHLMKISHVTRGDEWLPSYPKNILLYQAFNWTPPKFIHFPLILNKVGGGKLSKRQGDVFVEDYLHQGYLPEALINFSVLLGWHPKDDQELWSLAELETKFSITGLGTSPAIFDTDKLDYFNAYYLRQKPLPELIQLCQPYLEKAGRKIQDEVKIEKFITLAQDRLKKLSDIVEATSFLFELPSYPLELLLWKKLTPDETIDNLQRIEEKLKEITEENWTREYLQTNILDWLKTNGYQNGDYLWPLRVALSGQKNSPSPFDLAWALGKAETLQRLQQVKFTKS